MKNISRSKLTRKSVLESRTHAFIVVKANKEEDIMHKYTWKGKIDPANSQKRFPMKYKATLIVTVILLFQISCSTNNKNEKVEIDNQGVHIHYTDSKHGDTALLFIHGWGINQTYWANQVAHFSKNFRVVTLDLPGFGQSGKNRESWTVEDYTSDINKVLTDLDLKNVILVGHSMSGSIIVETALTHPDRIIGIIGIDNLKNVGTVMTPEVEKEWSTFYDSARKNFKATVSKDIHYLFTPRTDSAIQKRVTDDIFSSDTVIAIACLENLDKYPFSEKLKSLRKPLYLINSNYTPTDTAAFKQNEIDYNLLVIDSTGHYPMLEKPKDFNTLLEKAVNEIQQK
ncbi:alpha/beta fold hydrolase [Pseudochryseolinea flava]|nr:alpha/beta hydrolase [Pseudochryseolinea flava]